MSLVGDSEESDEDFAVLEQEAYDSMMAERNVAGDSGREHHRTAIYSPKRENAFPFNSQEGSTRPTTADLATTSSTPFNAREVPLPSSQTPTSIHASAKHSSGRDMQRRSPLKERSTNATSQRSSTVAEDVENGSTHLEMRKQNLPPTIKDDETQAMGSWMANLVMTPKKSRAAGRRTFVRTTTVQDSEDDSGFEISPVGKKAGIEAKTFAVNAPEHGLQAMTASQQLAGEMYAASTATLAGNQQVVPALAAETTEQPMWKRTGLVPDSEEGSAELEVSNWPNSGYDLTAETTNNDSDERVPQQEEHCAGDTEYEADNELVEHVPEVDANTSEIAYEEMYPQTYDPVSAALDRDAARFGKTETQLDAEQSYKSDEDHDDDDLDAGIDHREFRTLEEEAVEFVPSSQPLEKKIPSSPELGEANAQPKQEAPHAVGDVDDSGYGSHASVIPSSQPGDANGRASQEPLAWPEPHKSQVPEARKLTQEHQNPQTQPSHLVSKPTRLMEREQQSLPPPVRPSQVSTVGDSQAEHSRPNSAHGVPFTFTSPQKSARVWDLSSSPLPLPPESWCSADANVADQQTSSDGLADFSLPPPPPLLLSSSLRQSGREV